MMWRRVSLFMAALGALAAQDAHAGIFSWVDDAFTFREDQKARVSPRRLLPPKEVMVPYYDAHEAAQWSNYYTRQDLQPETFLTGSASKVMRPADDYSGQNYEVGGSNVMIGDPDQGPGMSGSLKGDYAGMGQDVVVRKPTAVGDAKKDWRSANGIGTDNRLGTSRPGDFDYGWRGQRQLDSLADGGEKVAGGTVTGRPLSQKIAGDVHDDPRYLKFNDKGQVTQYQVQGGDTLGGIAGQPAIYDNSKLWPLIYSANRRAIGKNVGNLKDGQKLAIPRNYTKAQAKDAERRSANHPADK